LKNSKKDVDREAELMGYIDSHPNVLKFIGIVEDDVKILIVLELCDHGNLEKYVLKKKEKISKEQIIHFAFGIACGLQSLHYKGIIHGDFALRNILLSGEDLTPKICDFGLSYRQEDYPLEEPPKALPINIMSPDDLKAKGRIRTKQSDIWAFGIMIWQMYTFDFPYGHYRGDNLVKEICNGLKPGDIEDIKNPIFKDIVKRCWDMDNPILIDEIQDQIDQITKDKD